MDRGARFYRCDFQVHTPRDQNWTGEFANVVSEQDRKAYATAFVASCRRKGINAVAITDHNDLCLFSFIRDAALAERTSTGGDYQPFEKLVVFPGIELTLSAPSCQVLVLFDPGLPDDALKSVWGALGVIPYPPANAKISGVQPLGTDKDLHEVTKVLGQLCVNPHESIPEKRIPLKGHFIVLPHVRKHGHKTILRDGNHKVYAEMPCVGGYIEGRLYTELESANREILEGKKKEYGSKKVAVFQTSDCRAAQKLNQGGVEIIDFGDLGKWSTWVKWTEPSAEALRQACLGAPSRLAHVEPQLPTHRICSVSVTNSKFLGSVELGLNPQFNAFVGGRGTGKSTLLEYMRWALCDDPVAFDPSIEAAQELPDFQKRRKSLIEKTLKAHGATVTVKYEKFGVAYEIVRSATEATEKVTVIPPGGTRQEMTGESVRREFPVVSYAQKQLSCVGTLPDEILRIVTGPVRDAVSRLNEDIRQVVLPRLKEDRQRQLRLEELRIQEKEVDEKTSLLRTQIQSLQGQLGTMTAAQQAVIGEHSNITEEKQWLATGLAQLASIEEVLLTAKSGVEQIAELKALEQKPNSGDLTIIAGGVNSVRRQALSVISELKAKIDGVKSLTADEQAVVAKIQAAHQVHETAYKACIEEAAKSQQQLEAIGQLNKDLQRFGQKLAELRSQIQILSALPDASQESPWNSWTSKHAERATLLRDQCLKITNQAQDAFKATLQPCAETKEMFEALDGLVSRGKDIRKREEKVRGLCRVVAEAADPLHKWQELIAEFDALARSGQSAGLPNTPILDEADFTEQNRKALQALRIQDVEEKRYVPIEDRIVFEFAFGQRPDGMTEFIAFHEASPGQQATALMRTLLSEQGPPLLIDQPEEDLDNEQIRAISERIATTKHNRQLVFVSHNANIVVNGDAELVVHFNYASTGTTKGVIERTGSIDYAPIKDMITSVMEGGRDAFELRKQKYGF